MKVFIVYAHPESRSFNYALKEQAIRTLQEQGHEVKVSDLYTMQFKAVADSADFAGNFESGINYMLKQQQAAAQNYFAQDIKEEHEKLRWADVIIFHFPIWWFSVPAILKGWFDRVFSVGVAWDFGKIYDQGLLKGKKAMVCATTGGEESFYQPQGAHGASINQVLYVVSRGTLRFCGLDVLPPFVAFAVFQAGEAGRKKYLADYAQHLRNLENLKPLNLRSISALGGAQAKARTAGKKPATRKSKSASSTGAKGRKSL